MASSPVPGSSALGDRDDQATLPPSVGVGPLADTDATLPPSGDPPAITVGTTGLPHIPGYEILSVLGQGGMGVVYKARHQKLHRMVALKMIRGSFVERQDQRQRFVLEAEAVARLQHTNIVQIFEIGDVVLGDGTAVPFMALEFVEGASLEQHLQGRPMPPASAAELVADLARAMEFAHERNIIHRDLKPANVLLGKWESASKSHHAGELTGPRRPGANISFCPKITDFGLAKQIDADSSQTKAGEIMGTPSYMAPEQAEAQLNIGPPADIYALGAILYELLTGRPPFRAATALDTILQVVGEEPVPPSRLQPGVPRDVETVCLKCLAKVPAKRYASAAELADDLDRFLRNEPIQARPITVWEKTWKWAKRRPSAAALIGVSALALVASLGGGIWFNHVVRLERDAALKAEAEAKTANALADAKGREAQANLDQLSIANGIRIADGGDLFGGLVWFTRPLHKDVVYRTHERMNRDRIAFYLSYSPHPTLRHTFWHDRTVGHAGFSPDGRMVVTSSVDETAQVWDAESGEAIGPALRHKARVVKSIFSPDARFVLTMSIDKTAQLWDARTGQAHGPPMVHPQEVADGEFSPDGQHFFTFAVGDKKVYLWNAGTSQPAREPFVHDDEVNFATFCPDKKTIAVVTGSKNAKTGAVHFWNVADGTIACSPYRLTSAALHVAVARDGLRAVVSCANGLVRVWSLGQTDGKPIDLMLTDCRRACFTPDGQRFVTYSETKKVFVWDTNTGRQVGQTIESRDYFRALDISPDGRTLVTGGDDKSIRVWNLETGLSMTPPLPHRNYVEFTAFSPDGRRLITASADKSARLWDLASDQPTPAAALPNLPLLGFAFSPDGRRIVTGGLSPRMAVCDARTAVPYGTLLHPKLAKEASFSPDGRWIASACNDGIVRLWDASTYQLVRELKGHDKLVTTVRFSPRSDAVFSTSFDSTARIWEIKSGSCRHVLKQEGPIIHGDLSPDGTLYFTGGRDHLVRLWNATTGELVYPPMPGHTQDIVYGVFSSDGRLLATTSWDYSTRLWDTTTGQLHCPPLMHDGAMMKVAFSHDGRRLATTSEDNTARLWDTETGQAVTPPLMHLGWALDAEFNKDGDRLLTGSRFRSSRFWNALTGQPISPLIDQPKGRVVKASFTNDESHFITASMDDGVRIWPIPNDNRPTEDLIRLAETYQGSRLDVFGGLSAIPHDEYRALWQAMKKRYPQDFSVSVRRRLAWHHREMMRSLNEKNAHAAALHFLHAYPQWTVLLHWSTRFHGSTKTRLAQRTAT